MTYRWINALAASAAIVLSSCGNRPEGVLSDKETVDLLADMYLADAYISQNAVEFPTDSTKKALRQSILAAHGMEQADLDSTLSWYGRHFDEYVALYEKVEKRLDEKRRRYERTQDEHEKRGDIKTLWSAPGVLRLAHNAASDGVYFSIDGAKIKKGERLIWNFRVVNPDASLQAFIAADYSDKYTYSMSRDVSTPGTSEIIFHTDSARRPTRVYGFIRLKNAASSAVWIDSVRLTTARLDPSHYIAIGSQTIFSRKGMPNPYADKLRKPHGYDPDAVNTMEQTSPAAAAMGRMGQPSVSREAMPRPGVQ